METFAAVRTMLAVREYEDRPVPEEIVARILEAARLTGSARNRQPWEFIVVQDKDMLSRLGELSSTGSYIANAPLAIVVLVPDSPIGATDGARAVQDMMLVAWEEGIGSNWVSHMDTPEVRTLLNIPDGSKILTVIPFGYPAKAIGAGVKSRKKLEEIAHRERYGAPFE